MLTAPPIPTAHCPVAKLFLRHTLKHSLAWGCLALAAAIVFTAPWWWQKLAALPCASIVAAVSIRAARQADRCRFANLVPYLDPVRPSNRTGQIVYQFVRLIEPKGVSFMTTTLEQLIASFLQIGLAKIDTKLSPPTQQLIDGAVPTLVSTIASVIVDLAENHKATKASPATK